MSDIRAIVSSILTAEGAIVEEIEPEGIEILAPETLQKALSIPEWTRMGFGAELPDQAIRLTLESDWMERIGNLLGNRGCLLFISPNQNSFSNYPSDHERLIRHEMVMSNATYRIEKVMEERTRYLLLTFRITAVSDEKRDDILHLCINESNGAIVDELAVPILSYLRSLKDIPAVPEEIEDDGFLVPWGGQKIRDFVKKALPEKVRMRLAPFLSGMERRMGRDMDRLYTYHTNLRNEAACRLADKKQKEKDEDELEREHMRIVAIEREYQAKIADLQRKYAMIVEVDLIQVLRLNMPVYRFHLLIMRRKGTRHLHLDWNPISRRLEPLLCEKCLSSLKPYSVCDDNLHLLCPACTSPCDSCGKTYCRICHLAKCPKCGHHSSLE